MCAPKRRGWDGRREHRECATTETGRGVKGIFWYLRRVREDSGIFTGVGLRAWRSKVNDCFGGTPDRRRGRNGGSYRLLRRPPRTSEPPLLVRIGQLVDSTDTYATDQTCGSCHKRPTSLFRLLRISCRRMPWYMPVVCGSLFLPIPAILRAVGDRQPQPMPLRPGPCAIPTGNAPFALIAVGNDIADSPALQSSPWTRHRRHRPRRDSRRSSLSRASAGSSRYQHVRVPEPREYPLHIRA